MSRTSHKLASSSENIHVKGNTIHNRYTKAFFTVLSVSASPVAQYLHPAAAFVDTSARSFAVAGLAQ
jgi:hypothetical protein